MIREIDRKTDRKGICAIETAFETDTVLDVVVKPRGIDFVERTLAQPLTKRFSIAEVFAQWARWDIGWVADGDGDKNGIIGFAAAEYEAWHSRLVLWHLYIQPTHRRTGIGRQLLARVEAYGTQLGADCVWLETSNVNVPGIRAYEKLGYAICGTDTTYYGDYAPDEIAVYLSKRLP
ncbi:MAG TPA: GNAT family N-acetyltransferase [Kofleriaceae bacterium]